MKKIFTFLVVAFVAMGCRAQSSPVSWSFSASKVADKTYDIKMVAHIQPKWHLYSQTQPKDAIAIPTSFTIKKNSLVEPVGNIKEIGKMEVFKDDALGISANQYADQVVFVQRVKLRANVKTSYSGNVEFQTCDDKKCLPPKTVNFSVALK